MANEGLRYVKAWLNNFCVIRRGYGNMPIVHRSDLEVAMRCSCVFRLLL